MQVIRLKKGYTIRLSDGEFEALDHLYRLSMADMEGDEDAQRALLSPAGKRGMSRLMTFHAYSLEPTDDRRDR